jgi:hypothetical protein
MNFYFAKYDSFTKNKALPKNEKSFEKLIDAYGVLTKLQ